MAKKIILKDLDNIEILPITRGELILDSSGRLAFRSNEFLATDSLPGLMSSEDKYKLDHLEESGPGANNKVAQINTTTNDVYRLLFSETADDTDRTEGARKSAKLLFNPSTGALTATILIGKLDWSNLNNVPEEFTPTQHIHNTSEVIALTNYSKADSASDLVTTDTLNVALGKLEYKADIAYDLVKGAYDGDGTIENLVEILKVLEGVKDTDTIQAIIGKYLPLTGGTVTGMTTIQRGAAVPLYINSVGDIGQTLIRFRINGSNASSIGVLTGEDALLRYNSDLTAYYKILDTGNTGISNGTITINGTSITPITSHQNLSNYVTLNTAQTISGVKTFSSLLKFTVAEGTSPFLVTSSTIVSNLNANYVNGYPSSQIFKELGWNSSAAFTDCNATKRSYGIIINQAGNYGNVLNYPHTYGFVLNFLPGGDSYTGVLMSVNYDCSDIKIRDRWSSGSWNEWRTLAFTDSNITGNAATADKLKNKVKIWGLDFDGSSDITATLDAYVNVIRDGNANYNFASDGSGNLIIGTTAVAHTISLSTAGISKGFHMLNNGNIGIGTTSPNYKLHVNGISYTDKALVAISNTDANKYGGSSNYYHLAIGSKAANLGASILLYRPDQTTLHSIVWSTTSSDHAIIGLSANSDDLKIDNVKGNIVINKAIINQDIHKFVWHKCYWSFKTGTWYRIMESSSSNVADATGDLIIYLHNAGYPATVKLSFGITYHNHPFLFCNWATAWSSSVFTKARIVYKTNYGDLKAYLEVCAGRDMSHSTTFVFLGIGWSLITPTATTEAYTESLNSKCEISLGSLMTVFSNNVYAPNFVGTVDWSNIANKPTYWANVPISATSSTTTKPTFAVATATTQVTTPRVCSTGRLTLNAASTALDLKFANDDTKSVILNGTEFKPFDSANGNLDLGASNARWKGLYAGTGNFAGNVGSTISTGDAVKHAVTNTNGSVELLVHTNRGLYDRTNSKWIIYVPNGTSKVYVPTWANKGNATTPVYFNSSGEPVLCTSYADALDGRYVKKAGDTMTGSLNFSTGNVIITTASSSNYKALGVFYKGSASASGTYDAQIGWHNTGGNGTGSICILPYATSTLPWEGSVGLFITKTDLKYNGVSVWHAGNDGSGSGLDADLLDGVHASGLLTALSSSSATNLSVTVGGTTKTVADMWATNIANKYSSRPTTINPGVTGDGSMFQFKCTSSVTDTTTDPGDGHILHFNWDNTGGYDSQLFLPTSSSALKVRGMSGGTWKTWATVLTNLNYTSYLGYIGTTAVQSASAALALTGITNATLSGKLIFTTAREAASISFLNGELIDGYGNVLLGTNSASWNVFNSSRSSLITVLKSGNIGIGTTSPSVKLHVAGLVNITANSGTLTIGCLNTSWTHYSTTGGTHWFNKAVEVNGNLTPHANNSFTLGTSSKRWSNVYSVLGNFIGNITVGGNQYVSDSTYGINMLNSDIALINSLYFADLADSSTEGIHFYRSTTTWDSLTAKNGILYFSGNRAISDTTLTPVFSALANSGNNISITIGGQNRTLTPAYATKAGNADTVDGIHASGFILTNSLMIHGAYAVIPTYNGETGWHRIATIDGGTGYGSWILYLCGDWSWTSNTTAILHINTMHTTAKITQVSGIVGFVTDVRLVPISANNYYVDVYINYSGANTPGTVYCYFLGNGAITTRTTAEKITASVSTAASIILVTGTRTNDNSYAAHFYENSDVMLKTNIKSITDSDNMPILKSFDWKSDGSRGYGLIAQELEAMGYPELVSGELDGTKTVNYSAALSLIVGKLQVKIKELEKEIEILKNKN